MKRFALPSEKSPILYRTVFGVCGRGLCTAPDPQEEDRCGSTYSCCGMPRQHRRVSYNRIKIDTRHRRESVVSLAFTFRCLSVYRRIKQNKKLPAPTRDEQPTPPRRCCCVHHGPVPTINSVCTLLHFIWNITFTYQFDS